MKSFLLPKHSFLVIGVLATVFMLSTVFVVSPAANAATSAPTTPVARNGPCNGYDYIGDCWSWQTVYSSIFTVTLTPSTNTVAAGSPVNLNWSYNVLAYNDAGGPTSCFIDSTQVWQMDHTVCSLGGPYSGGAYCTGSGCSQVCYDGHGNACYHVWCGMGPINPYTVYPTSPTTYTLSCSDWGDTASVSETVSVCAANSGQSCSASSACGTNYGTYQCNGSCSVSAPANPAGYGNACTSAANSCGQTNSGSIQCNGACSASTPANPAGYGNGCTSGANACGQTNSGSIQCNGACSASTPPNGSCPAPVTTLTPSSATIPVGSLVRLTWSATNSYTCTGTNFSTGGSTSSYVDVSPTTNITYSVTCYSSAGGSDAKSAVITVTYPDLKPCTLANACDTSATNTSGGAPVATDSLLLSAPLSNIGAATATNFPNRFVILDSAGGTTLRTVAPSPANVSSLAANSATTITASTAALAAGTYRLQMCANINTSGGGSITESNSGNNCSNATLFTVGAPPADLRPTIGNTVVAVVTPVPMAKQSTTLSTSFTNYGTAPTSGTFPDLFEMYPGSTPPSTFAQITGSGGVVQVTSASLATNVGNTVTGAYTFPYAGNWQVRACANTTSANANSVAESDYSNNCGSWGTMVVNTPWASLLANGATSITVPSNSPVTLSWSSGFATACTGTNFSTGGSTANSVTVNPVADTTYSISCANDASVPGTSSAQVSVIAANLSLTADPTVVRKGGTTALRSSVSGSSVTSCRLSGPGLAAGGIALTLPSDSHSVPVDGTATYTLSCTAGAFTPTVTTTVNLTPTYEEF